MEERLALALRQVFETGGSAVLEEPNRFRNMLADALGSDRAAYRNEQAVAFSVVSNGGRELPLLLLDDQSRASLLTRLDHDGVADGPELRRVLDNLQVAFASTGDQLRTEAAVTPDELRVAVRAVIREGGPAVLEQPGRFRNMLADAVGPAGATHRKDRAVLVDLVQEGIGSQLLNGPLSEDRLQQLVERLHATGTRERDVRAAIATLDDAVEASGLRPRITSVVVLPPVDADASELAVVDGAAAVVDAPDVPLPAEDVEIIEADTDAGVDADVDVDPDVDAAAAQSVTDVDDGVVDEGRIDDDDVVDEVQIDDESAPATVMVGQPVDEPDEDTAPATAEASPRRALKLVAAAAVVLVLIGGVAFAATRGDSPTESTASTPDPTADTIGDPTPGTAIDPETDITPEPTPPGSPPVTPGPTTGSTSPPPTPSTPPPTPPPTPRPTVSITGGPISLARNQTATLIAQTTNSTGRQWSDPTGQCSGGSASCSFTCQVPKVHTISITAFGPGGQAADSIDIGCS